MNLRRNLWQKWRVYRRLGLWEGLRFKYHNALGARGVRPAGTLCALRPKCCRYPVVLRYGASDLLVFLQIFLEQEYAPLRLPPDIRLVIDCGANVGYSSAYFLNRFPDCHVIAVEPDPSNFALLTRNMRPYGDRVTLLNAGIWSHETGLVVQRIGDHEAWRTQVRECREGEVPDVHAVDLPSLMALSGHARVDLLKVDIEGSEAVLFNRDSHRWLPQVDNIVTELHGPDCERAFFGALAGAQYDQITSGELTICENIQFAASAVSPS